MSLERIGEPIEVGRSHAAERNRITSNMPKGVPNSAAMYGICARPWGYEVSLVRNGERQYKQFGKASYGSPEQALLQAQDWRDHIVRTMPPLPRRALAEKPRANSTGVPGVFHRLAPGGRVRGWLAKTYIGKDEILRADFPVQGSGGSGDTALAQAVRERAQQLDRMTGLARVHPAEEAIRMGLSAHAPGLRAAKRSKSEITRRNNTSGMSGVHFKTPNARHPGYWLAITYSSARGSVSKAFSVKDHGPELAKQLAIAQRHKQLAEKLQDDQGTATAVATAPALSKSDKPLKPRTGARRNN
ncbi:AP2 domain-containing protein [Variovorax sp. H27-G14]|uniref:AP2 domain-containing protein n=1 Tax=Variovorax sp. H27-G14 TaxID=3111914 RepID=UPI0038FC21B3